MISYGLLPFKYYILIRWCYDSAEKLITCKFGRCSRVSAARVRRLLWCSSSVWRLAATRARAAPLMAEMLLWPRSRRRRRGREENWCGPSSCSRLCPSTRLSRPELPDRKSAGNLETRHQIEHYTLHRHSDINSLSILKSRPMSNYHHFTFINMTKNSNRNYEDGYKLDYQEDYNDGDKIRERMDQQFSEARMRRTSTMVSSVQWSSSSVFCLSSSAS